MLTINQDSQFVADELSVKQAPITIGEKEYNGQVSYSQIWLMCKNLGLKNRGAVYISVINILREKKFNLITP